MKIHACTEEQKHMSWYLHVRMPRQSCGCDRTAPTLGADHASCVCASERTERESEGDARTRAGKDGDDENEEYARVGVGGGTDACWDNDDRDEDSRLSWWWGMEKRRKKSAEDGREWQHQQGEQDLHVFRKRVGLRAMRRKPM